MSTRGKWDWSGKRPPTLAEEGASIAETPPHRSKKDRRRWCRGKEGIEHQPATQLSKYGEHIRQLQPARDMACGWRPRYRRDVDGKAYEDWSRARWSCWHVQVCSACGKILSGYLGRECPDFHEQKERAS